VDGSRPGPDRSRTALEALTAAAGPGRPATGAPPGG
jgi:hypothetical protein